MHITKSSVLPSAGLLGDAPMPAGIDLGDAQAPFLLARLDAAWGAMPAMVRDAALRDLRLDVPAPERHGQGPSVLPGGAVALRCGDDGVLVPDPIEAVALAEMPALRLQAALAAAPGVSSCLHEPDGLVLRPGIPNPLPPQACSIVQDATLLAAHIPAARGWHGRALVQWRAGGAVAWPLVEAPALLALAAGVAGLPIEPGHALAAEAWDAPDTAARLERLAPGVFERVSDLLADEVGDELRWSLAERAILGEDSVASRLVEALRLLPAQFAAGHEDAGLHLLADWPRAAASLAERAPDLAILAIEAGVRGTDGLQALREVLDGEGLFFTERHAPEQFAPLTDAAIRATARRLTGADRYGAIIAPPDGPQALFAMAATLAERTGGRVVVSAPCWNFHHRVDARDGSEAGNAGWFGMGAGLDELEWL